MNVRAPVYQPVPRAAFRSTERRTPDRPCLNCGDPTPGNFCRNCGQRKVEVHISLTRMLMEALDDQFSINSALPRTLGALVARPGHLTREYMQGKIARYIPPFRLYLVTSVVFFLALSFLPELRNPDVNVGTVNGVPTGLGDSAVAARHAAAAPTPPHAPDVRGGGPAGGRQVRVIDGRRVGPGGGVALPPLPPAPPRMGWLSDVKVRSPFPVVDSIANARLDHFSRMEPREAIRQIVSDYLGHVPQGMFVLLPVFAAMLKLLYAGSRRFYVEHFVFGLHVHAFAFFAYLVMIVIRWPPLVAGLMVWLTLYLYLAMKKVYGQGWIVTGMKYAVLGLSYSFVVAIAAVLTLVATFLLA